MFHGAHNGLIFVLLMLGFLGIQVAEFIYMRKKIRQYFGVKYAELQPAFAEDEATAAIYFNLTRPLRYAHSLLGAIGSFLIGIVPSAIVLAVRYGMAFFFQAVLGFVVLGTFLSFCTLLLNGLIIKHLIALRNLQVLSGAVQTISLGRWIGLILPLFTVIIAILNWIALSVMFLAILYVVEGLL